MDKIITEFRGDTRWLSNFAPCEVVFCGDTYPSTENAYQAAKTLIEDERKFFTECNAYQAKEAGKEVTMRDDWDNVKLKVMLNLNRQKYSQEPFRTKLLSTGKAEIQEGNDWGDTYWGICEGVGANNLGKIIMQIRSELQEFESCQAK